VVEKFEDFRIVQVEKLKNVRFARIILANHEVDSAERPYLLEPAAKAPEI
jgi:hypothetical protein